MSPETKGASQDHVDSMMAGPRGLNEGHCSIFYTDKNFPFYSTYTYASNDLDLNSALTSAFDDLLSNPLLCFSGFWFSKAWVGARTPEWQPFLKEATFVRTINDIPPLPPSSTRMFDEWRRNRISLHHRDPCRHYSVFSNDPSPTLHAFTKGVLSAKLRTYHISKNVSCLHGQVHGT
jgi:hypothetical protein